MNAGGMTEAQTRFADRLAEEVEAVLGPTIAIEAVSIIGDGPVSIVAQCRLSDGTREVAAQGATLLEASRALITAAAEFRLGVAWRRLIAIP